VIGTLPTFSELTANYPNKHEVNTKALLHSIGGQVRASLKDNINTCAIRMSWTLNNCGAPIRPTPGVHVYKGQPQVAAGTAHHAKPSLIANLYLYRVLDVKTYLTVRYGPGKLIYDGSHPDRLAVPTPGASRGIITFEWQGNYRAFGASGHADLFHVVASSGSPPTLTGGCAGECFFLAGPMIAHFWGTRP
jgi:hypothetical protein